MHLAPLHQAVEIWMKDTATATIHQHINKMYRRTVTINIINY